MLLPVFTGQNYSYSLEQKTGEYYLFKNNHKAHIFLKGKDARIFSKEIEHIDNLPPPKCNDGRLTEHLIKILVGE
jgi:hypothetical protein